MDFIKESLENFGWEVKGSNGSSKKDSLKRVSEDSLIYWTIQKKGKCISLVFFLTDTFGNKTTNLNNIIHLSIENRNEPHLLFDKLSSIAWRREVKEFISELK